MTVGGAGLILHVDDEQSVRASMAILLRTDGYEVSSAAGGTEALQLASDGFHPDVLIVDFNLGNRQMNGTVIAQEMRRILHYATPIIMLTGDVNGAQLPRMVEVVFWLACKPLNPQLLLTALPSLVQLSRATRKLLAQTT